MQMFPPWTRMSPAPVEGRWSAAAHAQFMLELADMVTMLHNPNPNPNPNPDPNPNPNPNPHPNQVSACEYDEAALARSTHPRDLCWLASRGALAAPADPTPYPYPYP